MKRIILLIVALISVGSFANAQTLSKKDAQKISKEINANIQSLDKALSATDWKEVQAVVDKTATILEKNADSFAEILEQVDFTKLILTMAKLQIAVEKNVDVEGMEKSFEKISKRIEQVVKEMTRDTTSQ